MSKQPPPAPTASAIGPCPTVIKIVGRPGTGSLPSTIAPPDHPLTDPNEFDKIYTYCILTALLSRNVVIHSYRPNLKRLALKLVML